VVYTNLSALLGADELVTQRRTPPDAGALIAQRQTPPDAGALVAHHSGPVQHIAREPLHNLLPQAETYLVQEVHNDHLRVSVSSVAQARSLRLFADLDDHEIRHDMTHTPVQLRVYVYLTHVVLPSTFAQRHETQQLKIEIRICSNDIQHDMWSRSVIARTNEVAITDNENQLMFVVVLELGEQSMTTARSMLLWRTRKVSASMWRDRRGKRAGCEAGAATASLEWLNLRPD
jgi:hypothetical protein